MIVPNQQKQYPALRAQLFHEREVPDLRYSPGTLPSIYYLRQDAGQDKLSTGMHAP